MLNFQPGAGVVVASDTQTAVAAIDDAVLNSLRMGASILEATRNSNLPAPASQKLLASMTAGLSQVVAGRAEMVELICQLARMKRDSNLAEYDYGCPDGWPTGSERAAPVAGARERGPVAGLAA